MWLKVTFLGSFSVKGVQYMLVNVTLPPPHTPTRGANYHIHCSNNIVKGIEGVSDYLFVDLIIQTQFQSTKTA